MMNTNSLFVDGPPARPGRSWRHKLDAVLEEYFQSVTAQRGPAEPSPSSAREIEATVADILDQAVHAYEIIPIEPHLGARLIMQQLNPEFIKAELARGTSVAELLQAMHRFWRHGIYG